MSIRIVHYTFEGQLRVEAETDDEARIKFQQVDEMDLARFAFGSLKVVEITEEAPMLPEPTEPEGLSRLKDSEMVRI